MTTLLEAETKMRKLADKASKAFNDESLTSAQKAEKIDAIQLDMKSASGLIDTLKKAKGYLEGGDASKEAQDQVTRKAGTSLGEQVAASAEYKQFMVQKEAGQRLQTVLDLGVKDTVSSEGQNVAPVGDILQGPGGATVTPYFLPGIVDLRFQPLVVADLFAQGTTTSPTITYVKETAFNYNANTVAESTSTGGSPLPESTDTTARQVELVTKIGHYLKVTDEMIADAPSYASFLNGRMILGVRLVEQNVLLNGSTGSSSNLAGLLQRSGLQSVVTSGSVAADGAAWADALYQQMTNCRWNAYVEPDGIVMHPLDWAKLRLQRDNNNQYFAGGPFTGAYGQNGPFNSVETLWGKPVVQTPSIAQGTALVGGFRECAQLFRRAGITVEMTNTNQDDFINNLVTVRAYERAALAVYRTNGFGTVSLSA